MLLSRLRSRASQLTSTAKRIPDEVSSAASDAVAAPERRLVRLMNMARRKFVEKNLDGAIEISTMLGMYSTAVSCQVSPGAFGSTGSSATSEENLDEEIERIDDGRADDPMPSAADDNEDGHGNKLSLRMISSSMDALIKQLMKRSSIWAQENYADDICLDGGFSIGLGMGGVGVSFSFTFSASVHSLQRALQNDTKDCK